MTNSDVRVLVSMIFDRPEEVKKLSKKEKEFLFQMENDMYLVGRMFSVEESTSLQALYRKVYTNL